MASLPSISFFRDVLEYDNFRRFHLGDNGSLDRDTFDVGIADFRRSIINEQQHLFECDRLTSFNRQSIDF